MPATQAIHPAPASCRRGTLASAVELDWTLAARRHARRGFGCSRPELLLLLLPFALLIPPRASPPVVRNGLGLLGGSGESRRGFNFDSIYERCIAKAMR